MKRIKSLGLSLAVISALSLGFIGCGSSGGSSDNTTNISKISGSIPANNVAYIPDLIDNMFASIGIHPLFADYIDSANKVVLITSDYQVTEKDLNADGSFNIDIPKDKSSVVFLANSNSNKIVGNIAIPVSSGSLTTLDVFPKGKINSNLNVGTLSIANGSCSSSSVSVSSSLSDDNATKALANIDDVTKFYANAWKNPGYYFKTYWKVKFNKQAGGDFNLTDKYLSDFNTSIEGWQPQFVVKTSEILGKTDQEIKMYFPTNGQNISNMTYVTDDESSGSATQKFFDGLNIGNIKSYSDSNNTNIIKTDDSSYGNQYITSEPFNGTYTLKISGVIKASFDSYNVAPYSTTGSMTNIKFDKQPLMLIKLNSDTADNAKIKSVTFRFQRYDNTQNQYIDLTDEEVKLYFEQSKAIIHIDTFLVKSDNSEVGAIIDDYNKTQVII